jgi:hypothetical protein
VGITFEDLKKMLGSFDASEEPLEPHHIWSALHNLEIDTEPGKDELKVEKDSLLVYRVLSTILWSVGHSYNRRWTENSNARY